MESNWYVYTDSCYSSLPDRLFGTVRGIAMVRFRSKEEIEMNKHVKTGIAHGIIFAGVIILMGATSTDPDVTPVMTAVAAIATGVVTGVLFWDLSKKYRK